jgi:DNA-binding response OmpR family regulator
MRENVRPAVKILVADDSTTVRRLLCARLKADGHEVIEAEDGLQALELARTEHPSLLLLDKVLPKLDGFEIVRRLKEDAQTRGLPIVMLTDQANEREVVAGLELGIDEYMTKPFSLRELSVRVSQLLERGSGSV